MKKEGETHTATVCALIFHYVHKEKRLGERQLLSLDRTRTIGEQDVRKLMEKKEDRERASYDTSLLTQIGLAEGALTDARDFVAKIRKILEEGLGAGFLSAV